MGQELGIQLTAPGVQSLTLSVSAKLILRIAQVGVNNALAKELIADAAKGAAYLILIEDFRAEQGFEDGGVAFEGQPQELAYLMEDEVLVIEGPLVTVL